MTLPERAMQRVRGEQIGMIFQNPMTHLDPVMTIGEQIGEALRFHKGISRREAASIARSSCCVRSASPTRRCAAGPTRTSSRAACASER